MVFDSRKNQEIREDQARLALDAVAPPFGVLRRALSWANTRYVSKEDDHSKHQWAKLVDSLARPRLLIISGCGGDSRRYRANHLGEIVRHMGGDAMVIDLKSKFLDDVRGMVQHVECVVFHRCAFGSTVQEVLREARRRGKLTLFDTDDLVFDVYAHPKNDPGVAKFGRGQAVAEQFQTMQSCHRIITSSRYLKDRVSALGLKATTLRNGFSAGMLSASRATTLRRAGGEVILGYASGTPTHDRDLTLIEDTLLWVLSRYNHVAVHLMGHIHKTQRLAHFGTRVQRRPFVSWQNLPQRLRDVDINLAPFCDDSVFSRGKSALKYMEAALVAVPTVASPMPEYMLAIDSGKNGLLAANTAGWRNHLQFLIEGEAERVAMGQAAQRSVLQKDSLAQRAAVLHKILKKAASKRDADALR